MGRTAFCSAGGLKKGAWTAEEDQKLIAYIQKHGEGGWRSLPEKAAIARHLSKRTDNEIKNYWNAHLKKRLANMGIDPVTHKPIRTMPSASSTTGAQESEPTPQKPTSSRSSTSASALLLNKLAARVTTLQCVDPLRACQTIQPMPFNATGNAGTYTTESTDIISHHTSVAPDTTAWLDNIADHLITPIDCQDLSNTVLFPESAEHGNASDDVGVSVDTNIENPVSEALSILENNAISELASSNFSSTSAQVLNNMASKFASLHCIDELHDWQNNIIPPGQIQGDHSDNTTYTGAAGLSGGDINIDDMIFDIDLTIGSPVF
ncbi:hypothetical protein REPUB_Repub08aG0066700 [Reevesia pubescens]